MMKLTDMMKAGNIPISLTLLTSLCEGGGGRYGSEGVPVSEG